MKIEGDILHLSTPTGESYAARLDGTDAPYRGDPGITAVSAKQPDASTIVETAKRDGTIISVSTMRVRPDGKTLDVTYQDTRRDTTSTFISHKQ